MFWKKIEWNVKEICKTVENEKFLKNIEWNGKVFLKKNEKVEKVDKNWIKCEGFWKNGYKLRNILNDLWRVF